MRVTEAVADRYDLVLVGSGFASTFFLLEFLKRAPADARVLVLERGKRHPHPWQVEHRRQSDLRHQDTFTYGTVTEKAWNFVVGFGGSSNCWWGNVPRMLPNDFKMQSVYGVGRDWPISYRELEPYYTEVEDVMLISGASVDRDGFRRTPYPLPPHRLSDPEIALRKAYPDTFLPMPTARASRPTPTRPQCCANGSCGICPIDAKFTVLNGTAHVYEDPRVAVALETEALAVETAAGRATGVRARRDGRDVLVGADLVGLGANALFNPFILARSGLDHPLLGARLHEQMGIRAEVFLDGMDHFQGTTSVTGVGYMLYDGSHRRTHAGCKIDVASANNFGRYKHLRLERGRWRQVMPIIAVFEDLPQERNRVVVSSGDPDRPEVRFEARSDYAYRGRARLRQDLERVFAPLPVERIEIEGQPSASSQHIQGTTIMGESPEDSIVDRHLVHHGVRNLVVLGSSVFPTGAPANPTLTLSALSLWSARHLFA